MTDARTPSDGDVLECLRTQFGLADFRPGQRTIIDHVLAGTDCVCVMPTGAGKSLCYQLPAVLLPGVTLVISPLIALMKDQVDQLVARGVRAAAINSSLSLEEQGERLSGMAGGDYDLVYIAPERFRSGRFVDTLADVQVARLAIDEAHCISEWGHDFRPDYLRIGRARQMLGNPPTIALTATATDNVRRDIVEQLSLDDPTVLVTGFDRPNLSYEVIRGGGRDKKLGRLEELLPHLPGCGIVYAATRNTCEEAASFIRTTCRRSAIAYHAGMAPEERVTAQEAFMYGKSEIVVATNAFGMGVDKPDIRFVLHVNVPGSIEAYYQEAGRAGRDGEPARCILLASDSDRYIQEFFIDNEYPTRDVVESVHRFLCSRKEVPIELTQAEIREMLGLDVGDRAVGSALRMLDTAGAIERLRPNENMGIVRVVSQVTDPVKLIAPNAQVRRTVMAAVMRLVNGRRDEDRYVQPEGLAASLGLSRDQMARALNALSQAGLLEYIPPFRGNAIRMVRTDVPFDELGIDFATHDAHRAAEHAKLDRMFDYVRTGGCRRSAVLRYFGEKPAGHCGNCDNCRHHGHSANSPEPSAQEPPDEQAVEVIKIILSGVARLNGRFGKGQVANMLKGSTSERMRQWRLDRLSTYGLLKQHTIKAITEMIDQLMAHGCVEQEDVDRFRPVVQITALGRAVMSGEASVDFPFEVVGGKRSKAKAPAVDLLGPTDAEPDPDLHESLRSLRNSWAQAQGVPPFRIFSNATLEELAIRKPQTPEQLLAVKGFGPRRVEQYGQQLLDAIAGDGGSPEPAPPAETTSAPAEPAPAEPAPPKVELNAPTHHWTWQVLERGFSPTQCAIIRGLDEATVLDHAVRAANDGLAVKLEWFLCAEAIAQLHEAVPEPPNERIRLVLKRLPPGVSYEHLQIDMATRFGPEALLKAQDT